MNSRRHKLTLAQPRQTLSASQRSDAVGDVPALRRPVRKRCFLPVIESAARITIEPARDDVFTVARVEFSGRASHRSHHRLRSARAIVSIDQDDRAGRVRSLGQIERLHGHQRSQSALGGELLIDHVHESGNVDRVRLIAFGPSTARVRPAVSQLMEQNSPPISQRNVTGNPDDSALVVDLAIERFSVRDDGLLRYPYRQNVARREVELHDVAYRTNAKHKCNDF